MRTSSVALLTVAFLFGCSGATESDLFTPADGGDAGTSSDAHGAASDADASPRTADSSALDAPPPADTGPGPVVRVRVDSVQTPGGDGTSQETPTDQRVGLYGLTLLKGPNDPSPLVVLDHVSPTDTPYNAGSHTLLGTVLASALTPGTYTVARVPVAYVNFTVAGTYHLGAMAVPGDFSDLIALTLGVNLDGATRNRGWWSSSFSVNGMTEGQTSGQNADIAQPGASSGISLDLSGAIAAYVFPVDLTIPPHIASDLDIVFTVNTYEDFHWQDQNQPGYEAGVFDVSPGSFEPVTQLGANSFTVTIQ